MPAVLLCTLNARYYHAGLGLRYLLANMGELEDNARILEFTIQQRPIEVVESILAESPNIVGFGVYIWNIEETAKVVAMLKRVAPEIVVVLGGPEVSHEWEEQEIVAHADYLITGWGDISFPNLCGKLLAGETPAHKVIAGEQPALCDIKLPYRLYTDHDLAHRLLYVEASRGCPFKCEFCLSSLDKTAWPFDIDAFLKEMDALHQRGARHFKFVDRTFNLNIKTSLRILEFFLERMSDDLFLHFEVIPDHLPDKLKEAILRFPPGSLQFEVGVQTFDPEVQTLISRKQDNEKTEANLRWLREHSTAHLHVDLIIGLPGEDMASFGRGFNRLVDINPHEIQVGILKRLRGTPIVRHTEAYGMRYNPYPPYNILATDRIDFASMQRLARFARYWDMVANSGRFRRAMRLVLDTDPFARFLQFSDWLYGRSGQTHQIALDRLYDFVFDALVLLFGVAETASREVLAADYRDSGAKGAPRFLEQRDNGKPSKPIDLSSRQRRHQSA
jgi:radical SAM superfamily enzyme YgiQ (UPF0313 family)